MPRLLALCLALATPLVVTADDLPRRAWLGAALEPAAGGVRVRDTLPGSSAEAAGLKPGDVIHSLDGQPVASLPDLVACLRPLRAGHQLKAEITRDDAPQPVPIVLKEWPRESDTDRYAVEYSDIPSAVGRLRTIAYIPKSAPAGAKRPALLIIQGLGAATLDNPRPGGPLDKPQGMGVYRAIADAAARAGLVALRVDKGGCGDSEGDPATLDFEQELDGYRSALAALRSRPDVDTSRIFLFGHSMGGVFAPILAAETPVRGAIVYGTVVKTWLEYLAENSRRQAMLASANPAAYDTMARLLERFHHSMIVDRQSPAAILKAAPDLAAVRDELSVQGDNMFGRHYTFFQQLSDRNLPEYWARSAPRTRVLALWGEAEFVTSREDHDWIAALVNNIAPGHGTSAVLEDSDHGLNRANNPADAMARAHTPATPPEFNPAILTAITTWIHREAASDIEE